MCCLHFWATANSWKKDLLALLSANICARHFPLLTFFLLFAGFSFRVFLSLLFHLFSTLHGLLPIGLLAQMMQKNHINGSRAPFWHFACAQKEKNNALTFSHLAGQLKRHNAAPAKSLTWPTCSGIFNLCDMRLHTHKYAPCAPRGTLCCTCNMHATKCEKNIQADGQSERRHNGWKGMKRIGRGCFVLLFSIRGVKSFTLQMCCVSVCVCACLCFV